MATFRRTGKYNNKRTEYKGVVYHSKKEAEFARTLDILKKARKPSERVVTWRAQVPFVCKVNGKLVCTYIADFDVVYADRSIKIFDVKGYRTAIYKLKKKLVEALHDIEIIEV